MSNAFLLNSGKSHQSHETEIMGFRFFCQFFCLTVLCPANEMRLDSTGVILSPGYPDSYPNLQMCAWTITVEKGYNISMFFEFFQTEKEFDILEVFDGNYIGSITLDNNLSISLGFYIASV